MEAGPAMNATQWPPFQQTAFQSLPIAAKILVRPVPRYGEHVHRLRPLQPGQESLSGLPPVAFRPNFFANDRPRNGYRPRRIERRPELLASDRQSRARYDRRVDYIPDAARIGRWIGSPKSVLRQGRLGELAAQFTARGAIHPMQAMLNFATAIVTARLYSGNRRNGIGPMLRISP